MEGDGLKVGLPEQSFSGYLAHTPLTTYSWGRPFPLSWAAAPSELVPNLSPAGRLAA